jgi:hypothetical protein
MRDINNNEILAEEKFLDKDIVEEKQIDANEDIESNHLDKILTKNIIRNIEKLDKISKNFSLLFEKPISSARESDVLNTMPENSKHIEFAIEKLKNESKQNISLFDEKLSELKSILSRGVNLNDNVLLEKIANTIADIENINYSISSINEKIENFSEVYEQKKIFESGFVDSTEISNKKNELYFQRQEYTSKFWRKIIYRNKIKDLDSEVKSLNNIKYDKYRYFFAPTIVILR